MNKRWMAVVMGALLVGALIGVVWVRPGQSAQAAGGTRKVNIPAALFQPIREGRDWWWRSDHLEMNTGLGEFVAPVVFPCLSSVTVERIILYAYDDSGVGGTGAYLFRTKPNRGSIKRLGSAYTGWLATSSADPTAYPSADINKVIGPSHGVYLYLNIEQSGIKVYGVTIEYHSNG
jgi:hypothetical protein